MMVLCPNLMVTNVKQYIHAYFITTSPKRIFKGNTVKVKIIY